VRKQCTAKFKVFRILEAIKNAQDEIDTFCFLVWIAEIHTTQVSVAKKGSCTVLFE
jgi:hypothetical protein